MARAPESEARSAPRPARGWEPYLVPYAAFLLLSEVTARLPAALASAMLPVNVLVPLALFLLYACRGRFPELAGYRPGLAGLAADAAVGLAVAVLWMAPFLLGEALPRPRGGGFDPTALGEALRGPTLLLRLLGFALVTPCIEELFVRSFLMRAAELVSVSGRHLEIDDRRDFRDLPVGRYTRWSFWITVLYFTFSHAPWEYAVALPTGIAYNLWLYRRRHLAAVVVAHAVTNLAIFAAVLAAAGRGMDLWYFL